MGALPDERMRKRIFEAQLSRMAWKPCNLDEFVRRLSGASAARIVSIIDRAALMAAREKRPLEERDLRAALEHDFPAGAATKGPTRPVDRESRAGSGTSGYWSGRRQEILQSFEQLHDVPSFRGDKLENLADECRYYCQYHPADRTIRFLGSMAVLMALSVANKTPPVLSADAKLVISSIVAALETILEDQATIAELKRTVSVLSGFDLKEYIQDDANVWTLRLISAYRDIWYSLAPGHCHPPVDDGYKTRIQQECYRLKSWKY